MPILQHLHALEILDSRGRPTLQVTCGLSGGATATAQVPSGASTGRAEAHELRDGDAGRHAGLGCRRAVAAVVGPIARAMIGQDWPDQPSLDRALVALDGTPNKERLGANAILGVSLAFARACARLWNTPLYRHFARLASMEIKRLPMPTVNLFSGGKHAGAQVALQDVLLVPCGAENMEMAMQQVCGVYHAAARNCGQNYGSRALVADEGGLAPPFPNTTTMLEDAVKAIETAGLMPGTDVALAVDVASSHFHSEHGYAIDSNILTTDEMIAQLAQWQRRFPILSFEDGLAEEDWAGWSKLTDRLGSTSRIMGDDLLCTNPERIRRAIECRAANALLLKVNQIGTLTEAQEARQLAEQAGWAVTVSARSGETEDDWLADLAVGWGGDHIKIGSVTRSERLAKYNRLLVIGSEEQWGFR